MINQDGGMENFGSEEIVPADDSRQWGNSPQTHYRNLIPSVCQTIGLSRKAANALHRLLGTRLLN